MAKKRTINEIRQTKEYYTGNDPVKQIMAQQIDEELEKDELEVAKDLIVDKITKHFHDIMFEMVSEEMSNNYLFQSDNYLTEAGYEMFEDEWFEFYHEHHGDILYQVMQNITN
jgi:hypothetical protein